ncbi:MAG: hypothetical protein ACYDEJ_04355 [Desulfitobacteriaceae bacterium]
MVDKSKGLIRRSETSDGILNALVIKDTASDQEIARHEFIIDIAFADNFGFSV